jgi:hypothetical protein
MVLVGRGRCTLAVILQIGMAGASPRNILTQTISPTTSTESGWAKCSST